MKYDYKRAELLVLLPCPMKAAFGKLANQLAIRFREEKGEPVNFLPVSAMDPEVLRDLRSITDPKELPEVMIVPGLGLPYSREFRERFRDRGVFESILEGKNPAFLEAGMYDPEGCYDIIGVAPIAFFADRTYHPELVPPKSWRELLFQPEYRKTVGMPGRETVGFQDFPIMAAYHLFGEEGVLALAKTVRSCLLPAEMVRMAGSRRDLAPQIGILNLAMAQAAGRKNDKTCFIRPEEGAFSTPITMLTRRDASEKAKEFARLVAGEETAAAFRIGGFYASADKKPLGEGKLIWQGWDFIREQDVPRLAGRLGRLMYENCELELVSERLREECEL